MKETRYLEIYRFKKGDEVMKQGSSWSGTLLLFAVVLLCATPAQAMNVTVAWDGNAESDLAGYKVYYGTYSGGPYNGIGASAGSSPIVVPLSSIKNASLPEFSVNDLPKAAYYFVVTAYNSEERESGYSDQMAVSPSVNQPPNGVIDAPGTNVTMNAEELVQFGSTGSDPDGDLPLSFLWKFGQGSGVSDSTAKDPGLVEFNAPGTFTVTLSVTDALGLSDPTLASCTIRVQGDTPGLPRAISQATWNLLYVDSEELVCEALGGFAELPFDGNTGTFWHTQWCGANPPPPHEIQIDLGLIYEIWGFLYLPCQDEYLNGTIKDYEFYVSVDGVDWGAPIASGAFTADLEEKEVFFSPKIGQFIRLIALSEINGNPWTCVAELNVLGNSP